MESTNETSIIMQVSNKSTNIITVWFGNRRCGSDGNGNAALPAHLGFVLLPCFGVFFDYFPNFRTNQISSAARLEIDNIFAQIAEPVSFLITTPMLLNAIGCPIFILSNDFELKQTFLCDVTSGIGLYDDGGIAHLAEPFTTKPSSNLNDYRTIRTSISLL